MKKKLIVLVLIVLAIVFLLVVKSSASASCKIGITSSNSNPKRGDEIELTINLSNIATTIIGCNFSIYYDDSKLTLNTDSTAMSGWNVFYEDDGFFIYSSNLMGVSSGASELCKIKFLVKDNANLGNTTVSIDNVEVTKEDYIMEQITGVSTTLNIEPKDFNVSVSKNNENITNGNVIVTLTADVELQSLSGWTLSSDKKKLTKSYSQNTTEDVTVTDTYGNTKTVTVEITNIDKVAPTLEVSYSTQEKTNNNVIVTITANEEIQLVSTWTRQSDKKTLRKEFSQNTTESVVVKDLAGNQRTATVTITNIDKTPPQLSIFYSTQETTRENVTVTITSDEELKQPSGWSISSNKKVLTKEYEENTVENVTVEDIAGNTTTQEVRIENITKLMLGDLNDNGRIDIGDLLLIHRHISATNKEAVQQRHPNWILSSEKILQGDLNKNGRIDIGDGLKIQRYVAANNSPEVASNHPDWLVFQ